MDYEKLYKEALERAKDFKNDIIHTELKVGENIMDYIFPVLKESEDERIRKELLESFKYQQRESCTDKEWLNGIKLSEVVAWLEKQSKENMIEALRLEYEKGKADALEKQLSVKEIVERCKKSWYNEGKIAGMAEGLTNDEKYQQGWHDALEKQCANSVSITNGNTSVTNAEVVSHLTVTGSDGGKCTTASTIIEPKFKVSDWVINRTNAIIMQIINNTDFYESVEIGGQRRTDSYNYVEWDFRLWTIQDAKEGDIIYIKRYKDNSEWLLIFKEIKSQNTLIDVYDYYAYSITSNNTYHHSFYGLWGLLLDDEIVCPATKEQRDILFQKIKEEGYEWDAEKKELKKIRVIDEGKAEMDYCFTKMMNGEKVNPAWSEEDEEFLRRAINAAKDSYPMTAKWLKSLKERIKNVKNR